MSLSGVLDQSDVERRGFASLLKQKLERLSMEDDVESEVRLKPRFIFGTLSYFLRIIREHFGLPATSQIFRVARVVDDIDHWSILNFFA